MTTILKQIRMVGKGNHSGDKVEITIKPSKKRGIYFHRVDIAGSKPILATYDKSFINDYGGIIDLLIKDIANRNKKDLNRLSEYAKQFHVLKALKPYLEVLL